MRPDPFRPRAGAWRGVYDAVRDGVLALPDGYPDTAVAAVIQRAAEGVLSLSEEEARSIDTYALGHTDYTAQVTWRIRDIAVRRGEGDQ